MKSWGGTLVTVDIESIVSVFQLRGIPTHLQPQKDSSRTSAGWGASLTPIEGS